jgi:L-arabinokinase
VYRILSESTSIPADTAAFIKLLNNLPARQLTDADENFFSLHREIVVTRAPGRLDLMGGIADYSGSLVLELPIANATHVALQRRSNSDILKIVSLQHDASQTPRTFEMSLTDFTCAGEPVEYETARERFQQHPDDHWAAYVAGAFLVLMRERGASFREGARILISSEVPEGKGLSSSAALEVAVMQAVTTAYEIPLSPPELALLCQRVENLVAGAPCGVMDQMTSACGEADRLLALLCQPWELRGSVRLPEELEVWGVDSGIRHSIGGADYGTVRTAAFMGYRIIADAAGLPFRDAGGGLIEIDDARWGGYLANVNTEEFEKDLARRLPERMRGDEFLSKYKGITDRVTTVTPERSYPVLTATRHPIYEHARVKKFAEVLENWSVLENESAPDEQAELLGGLMYLSHESYSACGLGSAGTDELVKLVRQAGTVRGFYGAKITGGGSGGTVAVLARRGAADAVRAIAAEYARRTGRPAMLINGSSPGAARFGHLKLLKEPSMTRIFNDGE